MVALATLLVLRGPWLGLQLEPADQGLRVIEVDASGPAADWLHPEMRIIALETGSRPPLDLAGYHPNLEPHSLPSFDAYDAYLERTGQVWPYLQADAVTLHLSDGTSVSLAPAARRSLTSLPPDFWLFHLFGAIALLISLSVWAFRRGQVATRLFALAGLGFFAATWSNSLYLPRELALPPALLVRLGVFNHMALYLMMASLLGLLMYFPRRLSSPFIRYMLLAIVLLMAAVLLNEQRHVVDLPLHDFYFPIIASYLVGIALAAWQWRAARGRPLDRAALRWLFLSLFISTGMGLMVYFIPALHQTPSMLSQVAMIGCAASMYVGLALGILRYRLFDLELWWFRAWLWFFAGLAVLAIDFAVVLLFGLQPIAALGAAVLAVGWIYFPMRQWLWRNVAADNRMRLEDHLPALAEALLAIRKPSETARQWRQVLVTVFNPLSVRRVPPREHPVLIEQGARLQVPVPDADHGLELIHNQHGARLFNRRDLDLARAMLSLAAQAGKIHAARETGAQAERRRIMRDLHDDVGARILSLIHGAQSPHQEKLARAALQALRETIYALDEEVQAELIETTQKWQLDVEERLRDLDLELHWRTDSLPQEAYLTARQAINLKRILHEAISNALSHAQPRRLSVELALENQQLCLRVSNDGVRQSSQGTQLPGRGLHNMRTRAAELGGILQTGPCGDGYQVQLRLHLPTAFGEMHA